MVLLNRSPFILFSIPNTSTVKTRQDKTCTAYPRCGMARLSSKNITTSLFYTNPLVGFTCYFATLYGERNSRFQHLSKKRRRKKRGKKSIQLWNVLLPVTTHGVTLTTSFPAPAPPTAVPPTYFHFVVNLRCGITFTVEMAAWERRRGLLPYKTFPLVDVLCICVINFIALSCPTPFYSLTSPPRLHGEDCIDC